MSDSPVKRPYRSPARDAAAQETRRRIRAAAADLFTARGYPATSMRAVAAAAGVSERTVFLAFPTKAALLDECIRTAIQGGEGGPPLPRGPFREALEAAPERIIGLVADASAALMSRAARLLAVGESVGSDPLLDEARRRGHAAAHADAAEVAEALERAGLLGNGLAAAAAADVVYSLAASESVYLRLVDGRGWTPERYARFLEDALAGALGVSTEGPAIY